MTLRRKGIVVPARGAADIPMRYMQKFIAANSLHKSVGFCRENRANQRFPNSDIA
jgi:hypothetical protein